MTDIADDNNLTDTLVDIASALNYPMVVLTTLSGSHPVGCLVGFSSQSSMEPFRYTVFLSVKNHTFDAVSVGSEVCVHFLASNQKDLARLFGEWSDDDIDKFDHCDWTEAPNGAPLIAGVVRWFAGPVVAHDATGDHHGFAVEPRAAQSGPWPGQLDYQRVLDLEAGKGP